MEPILKMNKILVLIPARYESSRFVGKPLALIHGKPMIEWVYKNCKKLSQLNSNTLKFEYYVVTDDERIDSTVKKFGGQSLLVKDDVVSGTERINLAYERFFDKEYDLIVNVQGDEPLITPEVLNDLVQFHLKSTFDMATVLSRKSVNDKNDFINPNMVKVIFNEKLGNCQYFSRAPIPYIRSEKGFETPKLWFHHIGIYSYRPRALADFCKSDMGVHEDMEKLEQLRAFELGQTIGAIETKIKLIGVDVKEDIAKLEEVLSETNNAK